MEKPPTLPPTPTPNSLPLKEEPEEPEPPREQSFEDLRILGDPAPYSIGKVQSDDLVIVPSSQSNQNSASQEDTPKMQVNETPE